MRAANVPGANSLPPYSDTMAFHQAVAAIAPNSYATNYFLSQIYGYTGRDGIIVPTTDSATGGYGGRGRSLAAIQEPANVFIMTEWSAAAGTGSAGWYTYLGYLNNDPVFRDRWRKGRRHFEGRQILFLDGHAKWYKDPPFEGSPGVDQAPTAIRAQYDAKQVYTLPS